MKKSHWGQVFVWAVPYVKLWRWSLDSVGDPRCRRWQSPVSRGELLTGCGISSRQRCLTVNSAERNWRSEELLDITHGDAEFGLCLDGFGIILTQYFLSMPHFLLLGMVTYIYIYIYCLCIYIYIVPLYIHIHIYYILCLCMFEVCTSHFLFCMDCR